MADYRIFTVRQDHRLSPRTGREHQFYVLETQDWINVILVTPEGRVGMIHQFRHGTAVYTLAITGLWIGLLRQADRLSYL